MRMARHAGRPRRAGRRRGRRRAPHGPPLHRRRDAARRAPAVLRGLWKRRRRARSVDLLGEATVTAAEADRYAARCDEALDELAGVYRDLPAAARCSSATRRAASRARTCR